VPLHWVCITARSGGDGEVQFREGIYGKDGPPGAANRHRELGRVIINPPPFLLQKVDMQRASSNVR
jgi:murein L,D-transpeptidase YcbB/YkuD